MLSGSCDTYTASACASQYFQSPPQSTQWVIPLRMSAPIASAGGAMLKDALMSSAHTYA